MYSCIVPSPSYHSCLQQIPSHNEDCKFAYNPVLFSISVSLCLFFLSGHLQGPSTTASVWHCHLDEQQRLLAASSLASKVWEAADAPLWVLPISTVWGILLSTLWSLPKPSDPGWWDSLLLSTIFLEQNHANQ